MISEGWIMLCAVAASLAQSFDSPPVDWIDRDATGAYRFGYATGDEGKHYHVSSATANNVVSGRFGYKDPATGADLQTVYTAGRKGFRARGPHIARRMDLSQNRPPFSRPNNDGKYIPELDNVFDPNEDRGYDFSYRTATHVKEEHADRVGDVQGRYSYVDDVGSRHTVEYVAGAGKGFVVTNPVPDTFARARGGALYFVGKRPGPKIRGFHAVQKALDGSYRFEASGPDHKRSEVSDSVGNRRGVYTYLDDKGIQHTVEYIAGPNIGYKVINNKKGTAYNPVLPFFPDTPTLGPFFPSPFPSTTLRPPPGFAGTSSSGLGGGGSSGGIGGSAGGFEGSGASPAGFAGGGGSSGGFGGSSVNFGGSGPSGGFGGGGRPSGSFVANGPSGSNGGSSSSNNDGSSGSFGTGASSPSSGFSTKPTDATTFTGPTGPTPTFSGLVSSTFPSSPDSTTLSGGTSDSSHVYPGSSLTTSTISSTISSHGISTETSKFPLILPTKPTPLLPSGVSSFGGPGKWEYDFDHPFDAPLYPLSKDWSKHTKHDSVGKKPSKFPFFQPPFPGDYDVSGPFDTGLNTAESSAGLKPPFGPLCGTNGTAWREGPAHPRISKSHFRGTIKFGGVRRSHDEEEKREGFLELPPGVAVRAHVQSLDIVPFNKRFASPGEALEAFSKTHDHF